MGITSTWEAKLVFSDFTGENGKKANYISHVTLLDLKTVTFSNIASPKVMKGHGHSHRSRIQKLSTLQVKRGLSDCRIRFVCKVNGRDKIHLIKLIFDASFT